MCTDVNPPKGSRLSWGGPQEEFLLWGGGGLEAGLLSKTAPEGSRALGESFLSLAVGDLAVLSLLGDSCSGACDDCKGEAFERLEMVHLRSLS